MLLKPAANRYENNYQKRQLSDSSVCRLETVNVGQLNVEALFVDAES